MAFEDLSLALKHTLNPSILSSRAQVMTISVKTAQAEKNELRDEKQRLKTEKDNLERQVIRFSSRIHTSGSCYSYSIFYPKLSCWRETGAFCWLL
ncbi:hypothetical protein Gotur_022240 [Gossypium turneri]